MEDNILQGLEILLTLTLTLFGGSMAYRATHYGGKWLPRDEWNLVLFAALVPNTLLTFYFLTMALNWDWFTAVSFWRAVYYRTFFWLELVCLTVYFLNGRLNYTLHRIRTRVAAHALWKYFIK